MNEEKTPIADRWQEGFDDDFVVLDAAETMRQLERRLAAARATIRFVWEASQFEWETMPEEGRKAFRVLVSDAADKALSDTE